jgi:hypothetical protein
MWQRSKLYENALAFSETGDKSLRESDLSSSRTSISRGVLEAYTII